MIPAQIQTKISSRERVTLENIRDSFETVTEVQAGVHD